MLILGCISSILLYVCAVDGYPRVFGIFKRGFYLLPVLCNRCRLPIRLIHHLIREVCGRDLEGMDMEYDVL